MTKPSSSKQRAKQSEFKEWRRALERGRCVTVGHITYLISADVYGRSLIAEINRLKRADPIILAKRRGRDVIDLRSNKPWHPNKEILYAKFGHGQKTRIR